MTFQVQGLLQNYPGKQSFAECKSELESLSLTHIKSSTKCPSI